MIKKLSKKKKEIEKRHFLLDLLDLLSASQKTTRADEECKCAVEWAVEGKLCLVMMIDVDEWSADDLIMPPKRQLLICISTS